MEKTGIGGRKNAGAAKGIARENGNNRVTSGAKRATRTNRMAMSTGNDPEGENDPGGNGKVTKGMDRLMTRAGNDAGSGVVAGSSSTGNFAKKVTAEGTDLEARNVGASTRRSGGGVGMKGSAGPAAVMSRRTGSMKNLEEGNAVRRRSLKAPSVALVTWVITNNGEGCNKDMDPVAGSEVDMRRNHTGRLDMKGADTQNDPGGGFGADRNQLMDFRTRRWNERKDGDGKSVAGNGSK